MTCFPDIHKRWSVRLRGRDYAQAAAYFVTICTFDKECLFRDCVDRKISLNRYGAIAYEEWIRTEEIRQGIKLDGFTIMPNHIHGIIVVKKAAKMQYDKEAGARDRSPQNMLSKSLSSFIDGFKAATTERINTIRNTAGVPVWESNYYEQAIRNEDELYAIRQYILGNPQKWDTDNENPSNSSIGEACWSSPDDNGLR